MNSCYRNIIRKGMTMPLFDRDTANRRKREGRDRAASRSQQFLKSMRWRARMICLEKGSVTIDDLRKEAAEGEIGPHHPNVWGCVFPGPDKQFVPDGFTQSELISSRGRVIRVWKLRR
jgi:hypothetical protein